MAVRVLLQFAKPTMRLTNPIWDRDGKPAAGRGSYLRDGMVRMLRDMELLSVVVEAPDEPPPWETIRDLGQQLLELEERFDGDQADTQSASTEPTTTSEPMVEMRMAIARHLTKQSAQLEKDPAIAAMRDPEAVDGNA